MSFYNVARNEAVPVIPGTMQSAGPRMRNNNLIGSIGIGLILTKIQPLCVSVCTYPIIGWKMVSNPSL